MREVFHALVCTRCGKPVPRDETILLLRPCACGCCVFKSSNQLPDDLKLSRTDLKFLAQSGISPE